MYAKPEVAAVQKFKYGRQNDSSVVAHVVLGIEINLKMHFGIFENVQFKQNVFNTVT